MKNKNEEGQKSEKKVVMKSTKELFHKGEMLTLHFIKNDKKGEMPIAKQRGIICFIDRQYKEEVPKVDSKWFCSVEKVNEKCLIVTPIAPCNSINAIAKTPQHSERKQRPQRNYQFERGDKRAVASR